MIAGALRRRDVDVALVLAVRRADEHQVAEDDRRRVRQVVRVRADFLHHVERPDDVGVVLPGQLLVGDRPFVLAVAEAVDVEAPDDAAIARVVEPRALDQRRRSDALIRPVVGAARRQLLVRLLPQELAGLFLERHQHAAVARLLRIAQRFVVRADEHHAAGDDRVAVALRAELGDPLHVLLRLDVPLGRQPLHVRHHVAIGRAAPHRPVAAAGIGRAERARDQVDARRTSESARSMRFIGWPPVSGCPDTRRTPRRRRIPARRCRLPIGSILSIIQAAGSGWPVSHALPRARTLPSAVFSTRSFRWYHASAFHANGTDGRSRGLRLPRLDLQLLRVAVEHQRVALRGDADVGHLAAPRRAAHVGLEGVVRPVGRADERADALEDRVVGRLRQHLLPVERRRPRTCRRWR